MPIEFIQESQPTGSSDNSLFRLTMAYDGSGRRISKTRWVKNAGSQDWEKELVTHYTSIGTEIRESFTGANAETKVVVNMPNGLGRYGIEDAVQSAEANASQKFEWYLKNHLGSTMLVYGTVASTNPSEADVGEKIAAYDYRAFGEMVELLPPPTGKVTENFTGKEKDDETELNYFGARYLDPMLGMWISVDPARQFSSPYLYAGNGYNPVNGVDSDGNEVDIGSSIAMTNIIEPTQQAIFESSLDIGLDLMIASAAFDIGALSIAAAVTAGPEIIAAGSAKASEMFVAGSAMFAVGFSKAVGLAQEFMSCPQCVIGTMMTATSKVYQFSIPFTSKRWDVGPISFYGTMDFVGGLISGAGPVYGRAERAGSIINEVGSGILKTIDNIVTDVYHYIEDK